MENFSVVAVERAIEVMRRRFADPLTVDDLARSARYSKFHFSRVFCNVTGISPGRYLSAIRIAEAKRLLVSTTWNIADISNGVGYNGIGTFSSRFHARVGVSPSEYRSRAPRQVPRSARAGRAVVRGRVVPRPGDNWAPVFVGLFAAQLIEGVPVRYLILDQQGDYVLDDVPEGSWYLLAHSMPGARPALLGGSGPVVVEKEADIQLPELVLRDRRPLDPPVLLCLLDEPIAEASRLYLAA